jgi:hypothetical protein
VSLPTTRSFSFSAASFCSAAFSSEMSTRIPLMTGAPLMSTVRSMKDMTGTLVPSFLTMEYSVLFRRV